MGISEKGEVKVMTVQEKNQKELQGELLYEALGDAMTCKKGHASADGTTCTGRRGTSHTNKCHA